MKAWWINTITLDEDGYVTGITAVVDVSYLPILEKAVYPDGHGAIRVIRSERGDTELWVELDAVELMALFRHQKKKADQAMTIPGCYDGLTMVVYGLMERD